MAVKLYGRVHRRTHQVYNSNHVQPSWAQTVFLGEFPNRRLAIREIETARSFTCLCDRSNKEYIVRPDQFLDFWIEEE